MWYSKRFQWIGRGFFLPLPEREREGERVALTVTHRRVYPKSTAGRWISLSL
jgi:hypothetical protein